MAFQVDDEVVYPACGVGRVVGLVTKRLLESEPRLYYEIAIQQSTVWVPVDAEAKSALRRLTPKKDLHHYRAVLKERPLSLSDDFRQRRQELLGRLRMGALQDMCEIVRDLTARSWSKPLSESEMTTLSKARGALCQEWAAADEVSIHEVAEEVDGLLREARQAFRS